MNANELKPGIIVRGPVLPEPIEVLVVTPLGDVIKIVGAGQKTGQVHQHRHSLMQPLILICARRFRPGGYPRHSRGGCRRRMALSSIKMAQTTKFKLASCFATSVCQELQQADAIDLIVSAWLGCKPLVDLAREAA